MEPASYLCIGIIIACMALTALRRMLLTFMLLIANIAVFTVLFSGGQIYSFEPFWELAFYPSDLASGANLYSVVTSIFVHAGILHIAFNMVWLVFIGMMLEDRAGKVPFAFLYFATGIIGNLVFAASVRFEPVAVVGASGAIYGVFGAFVRLYPHERLNIYFITLPAYMWFVVFFLLDIALGFFQPFASITGPVAYAAHIGGLAAGFLLAGLATRLSPKDDGGEKSRKKYEKLTPIVTTLYLEEAYANLQKEDDPAARRAWVEKIAAEAKCPECGGILKAGRSSVSCASCGFLIKF